MVKSTPPEISSINKSELTAVRIAELCSEPQSIMDAMRVKHQEVGLYNSAIFDAVYVVAPDDLPVAKVGIARRPAKRLESLQCGSWHRLRVRALFWCFDDALGLEGEVLRQVKRLGAAMEGEWTALEHHELAKFIAVCAKKGHWLIGNSRCYVDTWHPYAQQRRDEEAEGRLRRLKATPGPVTDGVIGSQYRPR